MNKAFTAQAVGNSKRLVPVIADKGHMAVCASLEMVHITKEQVMEFFGLVDPIEAEKATRLKVVDELRFSAFMYCDVNKLDVLLTIKHGCTLIEAKQRELTA